MERREMERKKILLIDRDERRRNRILNFLSALNYEVKESNSFEEISPPPSPPRTPDFVLLSLPHLNENIIGLLKRLKNYWPKICLILLGDFEKADAALSLLKKGIIDHIAPAEHLLAIYSALRSESQKRKLSEKNYSFLQALQKLHLKQKEESKRASSLEEIYSNTLENLMAALDLRDVETFGHSKTVAKYSQVLAEIMGEKDRTSLENVRKGALLHDVGKIAIPDSILKKTSPLTRGEWEKIKLHPVLGFGLIKEINSIKEVGNIILYHHERYDGNGYPHRLKEKSIPQEARIFALADALDAITSYRPYRKERNFEEARKEIQKNSGTQFDPTVVEAFLSVELEDWKKIKYETTKIIPGIEEFLGEGGQKKRVKE